MVIKRDPSVALLPRDDNADRIVSYSVSVSIDKWT